MKAFIIGLIAVVVIGGGGYLALQKNNKNTSDNSSQPAASSSSSTPKTNSDSNKTAAATITYSDSGFSPGSITVKSGDTVAIKNDSSGDVQFDSDPHPVHSDDQDLNVGTVATGQTVTFTVTQKGTFGFHNHLNPGQTGSITVQ